MGSRVRGLLLLGALVAMALPGHGQAVPSMISVSSTSASATSASSNSTKPAEMENVPRVPGLGSALRGLNGGITYAGVHNSTIGWYEVVVPAVSYSFSEHYSADASAAIYLHRFVQNLTPSASPNQQLVLDMGDSGDTLIGMHGVFHPHGFYENATATLTAPTGDRSNGLGTGRVTFDFNNHLERFFGAKGLHLDMGMGDSSAVANSLLMRDYNTLGPLAHFETGVSLWMKRWGYVQSSVYEQLPVGSQKVYELTNTGAPGSGGGEQTEVVVSNGLSEDNGFTSTFGVPLNSHLMFSGYYNRSLRQHQDTMSLGMTVVFRSLPGHKHLSMIDRALREAAGLSPEP